MMAPEKLSTTCSNVCSSRMTMAASLWGASRIRAIKMPMQGAAENSMTFTAVCQITVRGPVPFSITPSHSHSAARAITENSKRKYRFSVPDSVLEQDTHSSMEAMDKTHSAVMAV